MTCRPVADAKAFNLLRYAVRQKKVVHYNYFSCLFWKKVRHNMEVSHTSLMRTDTVTKNKQRILDNTVSLVLNIVHNQTLIYWSGAALICYMDCNHVRCSVLSIFRSAPGTRRKIKARMHNCFNRQRILFLFCRETKCFYNVARGTNKKPPQKTPKTRPTSKIKFPFFKVIWRGLWIWFSIYYIKLFFLWNFWT